MNEVFVDTKKMPIMKKLVKPTDQQTEFESRRYMFYISITEGTCFI